MIYRFVLIVWALLAFIELRADANMLEYNTYIIGYNSTGDLVSMTIKSIDNQSPKNRQRVPSQESQEITVLLDRIEGSNTFFLTSKSDDYRIDGMLCVYDYVGNLLLQRHIEENVQFDISATGIVVISYNDGKYSNSWKVELN
ncbi:hypothetical protein [Muribaculum sp.]|uniref:hypothetical protein n=1 Tax=Muribaculum sp. TaxID=1918611 RepID=UPI0023CE52B0|nr:hypothetical protein [Muribaculum sp.]MDE5704500.1 hypothetical protein [Muribaculum sp.]